ncbi:contact-dependent growth inhibition system immunity protein [Virgisporangium aurantiacum]|uniref:Uncharacterized protein n=1 Tax=Virgisporangium aurantiacum TaxID=175570 RepID=A0A8J4DZH1_9ACTN|nr:contact-dependent growth inhibition system immunity protein [Virgisporangium aurantiacum]GIJ54042.1 hypothetical protein Vau01_015580 [Virgisporangium aurantiacum]
MTTIEQIDGVDRGDPPHDSSTLVRRCTTLRRKSLDRFTPEDLRIMLGQREAVPILLPLAVDMLVDNPLAEGDFYPGDLLMTVLRLPSSTWVTLQDGRRRLTAAVAAVDLDPADLPPEVIDAVATAKQNSV